MNDENGNNGNDEFPTDKIPANAPPELKILATNVSEILNTLVALKGAEYTNTTIYFVSMLQQVRELEKIACESSQFIIDLAQHDSESAAIKSAAESKHHATHLLGETLTSGMMRHLDWFNTLPSHKGIKSDVEMILNRIKADWIDKGH